MLTLRKVMSNQWYLQSQKLTVDCVLFTCSKHSGSYFSLVFEKASSSLKSEKASSSLESEKASSSSTECSLRGIISRETTMSLWKFLAEYSYASSVKWWTFIWMNQWFHTILNYKQDCSWRKWMILIYTHVHACTHPHTPHHIHACMHAHIHTRHTIHMHARMHIHTHTHTHTHAYIHTYTHTHTHTKPN